MNDWITPNWSAPANVRALVTTRAGGASANNNAGAYQGLNLGMNSGDDKNVVMQNRAILCAQLPSEPKWLKQVHGNVVVNADTLNDVPEADASIARHADIVCAVMMADCMPVLLTDKAGAVVGIAHAGWRGLASGVIENTIRAMDIAPDTLLAWLGPAIGPNAFEVGDDVRDAFLAHDANAGIAFTPQATKAGLPNKWKADLFALARMRLQNAGITHISGGGVCTYSDPARFYSHRRDKVTGRMAALIWKAA